MLVLARKKGEALVLDDNIEITILEIQGEQVKIGIDAPKNISIYRKEVYLSIIEENKKAVSPNIASLKDLSNKIKSK